MPAAHPKLTEAYLSQAPLERADTIPSAWYTDPFFHAVDLGDVFGTTWQYVGAAARIPNGGDYLSADVGRTPVMVVRQNDGTVSAFYNVCKHRGGPLVTDECGSGTMLQCKYHGWTYRLDGSLRGVPRFDRTELFDKRDFGLTPLQVDSWRGLLFVRESGTGPALETVMHGIPDRIAPIDLQSMSFHGRTSYDVSCNWKVYVDNFLEGYHLPLVHPELCDALDYGAYVTEVYPHYSLQCSPMRGASAYGNTQEDQAEAFYYLVYPNFMLNILPGRLQTNIVLPVTPNSCRVIFDYYYRTAEMEEDPIGIRDRARADYDFSDRIQQEDIGICEHVQRGLESPAYDQGRFSAETEAGVHHFQSLLKETYRAYVNRTKEQ